MIEKMVCITTECGAYYEITKTAFDLLSEASHAGQADVIFRQHAKHVPGKHRLAVWCECEQE